MGARYLTFRLKRLPAAWKTSLEHFFVAPGLFEKDVCDAIVADCLTRKYRPGYSKGQCAAFAQEYDTWGALKTVTTVIEQINCAEGLGLDLYPLFYGIFNTYATGETYGWHSDFVVEKTGRSRVMSAVVSLSEPGDFRCVDKQKGFEIQGSEDSTPELGKGDVVIFPSRFVHRASELVSGVRHSLAMWIAESSVTGEV